MLRDGSHIAVCVIELSIPAKKDLKASMEERPSGLWQLLGKRFPSVRLKLSTSEGKTLYTGVKVLLCKVLFPKIPSKSFTT